MKYLILDSLPFGFKAIHLIDLVIKFGLVASHSPECLGCLVQFRLNLGNAHDPNTPFTDTLTGTITAFPPVGVTVYWITYSPPVVNVVVPMSCLKLYPVESSDHRPSVCNVLNTTADTVSVPDAIADPPDAAYAAHVIDDVVDCVRLDPAAWSRPMTENADFALTVIAIPPASLPNNLTPCPSSPTAD
jgi:hypothetical protein